MHKAIFMNFLLNGLVRALQYRYGTRYPIKSKPHSVSRIRIWLIFISSVLGLCGSGFRVLGDPELWHITAEQKNPLFYLSSIAIYSFLKYFCVGHFCPPVSRFGSSRDTRYSKHCVVNSIHHGFVLCKHNNYYRQPVFRIRIRIHRIHMFLDRIH